MNDANELASEPKKKSRDLQVKRSATGKGVFARRWIRTDVVIGEIQGEVIFDPNYGSEYCFDLEDGSYLEPSSPFRFLNHSCEPNCEFRVFTLKNGFDSQGRRCLMLSALDDIGPGEQLTIDYNWPLEGAIPCRCGAPSCRKWVVAEAVLDQVEEAQGA